MLFEKAYATMCMSATQLFCFGGSFHALETFKINVDTTSQIIAKIIFSLVIFCVQYVALNKTNTIFSSQSIKVSNKLTT